MVICPCTNGISLFNRIVSMAPLKKLQTTRHQRGLHGAPHGARDLMIVMAESDSVLTPELPTSDLGITTTWGCKKNNLRPQCPLRLTSNSYSPIRQQKSSGYHFGFQRGISGSISGRPNLIQCCLRHVIPGQFYVTGCVAQAQFQEDLRLVDALWRLC